MVHLQEFCPEDGQEKLCQRANSEYGIKEVITMALIDNITDLVNEADIISFDEYKEQVKKDSI